MADLLIELFSEEIPARMQKKASDDLKRMMADSLKAAGLTFDAADAYATPRRLTLHMTGIPVATPDVREERRGPRADAPEKAIEGFLRGAGIARDACEERETPKGTFLFAVIEKKGRDSALVIADALSDIVHKFPWPKSQRWGNSKNLSWVRPLHSIVCVFNDQPVSGSVAYADISSSELEQIKFGNKTQGHRFMAPGAFEVSDFADYQAKLLAHKVMLDPKERMDLIEAAAKRLAADKGLEWVEDRGLLQEVAGLVEWPVPLMGGFDPSFMEVPEEVLILTMKKDQKYFVTRDLKTGKLAPHFITVANIEPSDGGDAVARGNERVLSARLSDAKFFWEQDLKGKLDDNLRSLGEIVFHKKLGTLAQRVGRMVKLSGELATKVKGCHIEDAKRAAELAKADLVSHMVYEFPEVQGAMGRYYALAQDESNAVADAIKDHYAPLGPNDECPTAPVSVALALAEKLDTLVSFFAIDEKPTGSKDPFALRRAALGVIRLITENSVRISITEAISIAYNAWSKFDENDENPTAWGRGDVLERDDLGRAKVTHAPLTEFASIDEVAQSLKSFFADRLKVQQREKGVRHDLIDAVFANGDDDLVRVLNRVDALSNFLETDDGANLLAGYKRAANILKIEERKDDKAFGFTGDDTANGGAPAELESSVAESELYLAVMDAKSKASNLVDAEDFRGAMALLANLRKPIDNFFEHVIVNADEAKVRENRLNLLAEFRNAVNAVANFDTIEG